MGAGTHPQWTQHRSANLCRFPAGWPGRKDRQLACVGRNSKPGGARGGPRPASLEEAGIADAGLVLLRLLRKALQSDCRVKQKSAALGPVPPSIAPRLGGPGTRAGSSTGRSWSQQSQRGPPLPLAPGGCCRTRRTPACPRAAAVRPPSTGCRSRLRTPWLRRLHGGPAGCGPGAGGDGGGERRQPTCCVAASLARCQRVLDASQKHPERPERAWRLTRAAPLCKSQGRAANPAPAAADDRAYDAQCSR